jgi:CheY-like chemotaxis protein
MRRVLFLDDSRERHDFVDALFRQVGGEGCSVRHCYRAADAVNALASEGPFDCVFLDHDLEQADPDETGMAVAAYIADHLPRDRAPGEVVVHSWNPTGALRMEQALREAGVPVRRVPFGG